MYTFTVEPVYKDGTVVEPFEVSRMFLDHDRLPNLPIIEIETPGGEEPSYSELEPPKGYMGATIENNEYIDGTIQMSYEDGSSWQDSVSFKIRGNTSAYGQVKPYRLKLPEARDLLNNEAEGEKREEWLLIPQGHNLKTLLGNYVAGLCGSLWQPRLEYVNLIINGDWRGCYILIEPVDENNAEYRISDTGFLIENDGYWWKENEAYFKSEYLYYNMEYTVKSPNYLKVTDADLKRMKQYMDHVEESVFVNGDYSDYIDVDSFVSWILAHDVIGTRDNGGSNMFLYKRELSDDETKTKLAMGPIWDLDSIHRVKGRWSGIHDSELFYYKKLFEYEAFTEAYAKRWNEVGRTLYSDVERFLDDYLARYGAALQSSWDLHAERWNKDMWTLEEQRELALEWYGDRVEWMNENVR